MAPEADAGAVELCAVTPGRGDAAELESKVAALGAGGLDSLVLREKQLAPAPRLALAERIAQACRAARVELWVSDDVELARSIGAFGVQLSEAAPPPSAVRARAPELALAVSLHDPLSRPAHEVALCRRALLAPLLPTPSKAGAPALGVARFLELAAELPVPAFALGGIGRDDLPRLAAAGIRRVAAIRLFFDAADAGRAVREARALLEGGAAARLR